MTAAALALVLVAAFTHAGWNYLLKRSGGGTGFVWLFAAIATLLYAPVALVFLRAGLFRARNSAIVLRKGSELLLPCINVMIRTL